MKTRFTVQFFLLVMALACVIATVLPWIWTAWTSMKW